MNLTHMLHESALALITFKFEFSHAQHLIHVANLSHAISKLEIYFHLVY